ncbi:MAG: hypothetical protein H6581_14925 [Bacteroidia bacterium]|nr:hypothetical protein [Bacteroidia bacterium]
MKGKNGQSWLYSAPVDGIFILFPAFATVLAVILFPHWFLETEVSPLLWFVLVVGIDVAHVYSTLYRTYFDREEFQRYKKQLILLPILGLLAGIALYWFSPIWFWRILAYLAVYHFVRQQYGFFALYRRQEKPPLWERRLEEALIYLTTIYPLVYWHTHSRSFHWFVKNDFLTLDAPWISDGLGIIYLGLLLFYLIKEVRKSLRNKFFNLPKNLILLGTALSWYVGIVLYNGDLIFTLTNVVAHGIPYMALIWIYGKKKGEKPKVEGRSKFLQIVFHPAMVPLYFGFLVMLGYLEEGLWDGMVWRDHEGIFPWAQALPFLQKESWLALVVPLLSLPQATHYLIDGFIWRVRRPDSELKKVIFQKN